MPLPAVSNNQPDVMIATLFFNKGQYGWSEKYIINGGSTSTIVPTYGTASSYMSNIIAARMPLLALNCDLVWARLSLASVKGDSVPLINTIVHAGRVNGETTVEVGNKVNDSFVYRMDDMAGTHATRHLRGLRDTWTADDATLGTLNTTLPTDTDVAAAAEGGGLFTAQNAIFNFWVAVIQNSVMAKRNTGSLAGTWKTVNIRKITFRGTSTRNTGRPFGLRRGRASTRA